MADVPLVGPSYNLDSRPASVQRTINMVPVPLEPGNERTGWALKDVPGLRTFSTSEALPSGVLLLARLSVDGDDASIYDRTPVVVGTPTFGPNGMTTGSTDWIEWGPPTIPRRSFTGGITMEAWSRYRTLRSGNTHMIFGLRCPGTDNATIRLGWVNGVNMVVNYAGTLSNDLLIPHGAGVDVWTHFRWIISEAASPSTTVWINGNLAGTFNTAGVLEPDGWAQAGEYFEVPFWGIDYDIQDFRVSAGALNTGPFTPPPRGSL